MVYSTGKKVSFGPSFILYKTNISNWLLDLNVKDKSIMSLRQEEFILGLGLGKGFLSESQKACIIKKKIDKLNYIKKGLLSSAKVIKKVKSKKKKRAT